MKNKPTQCLAFKRMNNKYTTTTQEILELHKLGVDSYNIVVAICDNWNMSAMRASVMVDYVLNDVLYPKAHETIGECKDE